ncbi:hypothetical protein D0Y65_049021 [Glycine soja]|uniref:Uncharacterized protein n=1 Tax=Glycine soja TaxID=3848 RepID=A0A445FV25_GLYSO|nr:hypothetical protein D0Y65_049021 [Glycine soja]
MRGQKKRKEESKKKGLQAQERKKKREEKDLKISKPWGNIGAWTANSELAKADEAEAQAAIVAMVVKPQRFPSLKEAMNSKPMKKKGTTITLFEFNCGSFDQSLMHNEMLSLPFGPKEYFVEEI